MPSADMQIIPKDFSSWTHVFLRKDAVKAPLTPPYTGPYHVLSRTGKLFTLDINGKKKKKLSIDWMKRASLNKNTRATSPLLLTELFFLVFFDNQRTTLESILASSPEEVLANLYNLKDFYLYDSRQGKWI